MKSYGFLAVPVLSSLILAGCGSSTERAQENAYKAQQNVAEERLKLVEQYKDCVKDAGDDAQKAEACDHYLRAADALK
jgi:outer membrane murein-binding lipoprotein Lpp